MHAAHAPRWWLMLVRSANIPPHGAQPARPPARSSHSFKPRASATRPPQLGKYNLKFGDKGKTYDLKVLCKDDPKDEGWLNVTKGSLAEVWQRGVAEGLPRGRGGG